MGALTSRQHGGVEEIDIISNHAYKYPPKSGNYFGSHFIMGGERFDTPQPESYLFGENSDLNFLGSKPTPFPYPPPQPNEPTKTLKSLVNIRKESLRFVRAPAGVDKNERDIRDNDLGKGSTFNIEFTFDCDVRCAITINYFCTEEFTPNGVVYVSRDPKMTSEIFHYNRGANQQFCQMTHIFDPSKYNEDELLYDVDREIIPIAIHCIAEEGPEDMRQSHTTIATTEKCADGTYVLKALKQKLFVDGLCYLLQEIYGIENKNNDRQSGDDETEDNGSECVICMCDVRDTLILPCRHLCLCNACADSLRYQANNCPICRAPFRALLQIRALQKCLNPALGPIPIDGSCDNIPPGYEAVSLIEALNGPCLPRQPPSVLMPDLVETPDNEQAIQAAQILNCNSPTKTKETNSSDYGVLMTTRDEDNKETQKCPLLSEQSSNGESPKSKQTRHIRDSVKLINEKNSSENNDEDSEAEKLSLLLQNKENIPLSIVDVVESIDDEDTLHTITSTSTNEKPTKSCTGDDSDYYTPDEPTPSSGPLYDNNVITSSVESTPQRLPGTPLSHASGRSSGDSYTSGSSTRHLLAIVSDNGINEKAVHI